MWYCVGYFGWLWLNLRGLTSRTELKFILCEQTTWVTQSHTQSSVIKAQFYFLWFCSGAGEKVKVTAHLRHFQIPSNHLCKHVLRNREEWCDVFMRPRLERKYRRDSCPWARTAYLTGASSLQACFRNTEVSIQKNIKIITSCHMLSNKQHYSRGLKL